MRTSHFETAEWTDANRSDGILSVAPIDRGGEVAGYAEWVIVGECRHRGGERQAGARIDVDAGHRHGRVGDQDRPIAGKDDAEGDGGAAAVGNDNVRRAILVEIARGQELAHYAPP